MRCPRLLIFAAFAALLFAPFFATGQSPAKPAPAFIGQLSLVRYDMPIGLSDGYAPTRQLAVAKADEDAVDWPDFTLNDAPIFRGKSEEKIELKSRSGAEAKPLFQARGDDVIQPGNHWFRALEWRLGRRHIYTADKTARCANTSGSRSGKYELWTFPISIKGEGGPVVKNVELSCGGKTVYRKLGPWRSLTLLLPASEPGKPFELRVAGRPTVTFQTGLMPVKLGDPRERVFPVNAVLAGDGPRITISNLARPERFPNPKEWAADVAALGRPLFESPTAEQSSSSLSRHLGVDVPHSPLTIYAAALPHGMSGGFFKKGTKADDYAELAAETGYDAIFDPASVLAEPGDSESFEQRAAEFARRGVQLGLQYDNNWTRPALQHPNVAFFAHTLPEWHAPLYRSLSLAAQRFASVPNFAGIQIGADCAGYAPFWDWAPPIPDRPWGEGMIEFMGTQQPRVPVGPGLGASASAIETPVKTMDEFIKYVQRYDASFRQYGYFAEAVREVDPGMIFTTGSFGSSPGQGGRGGWPWASIPGRDMFGGFETQQAYDWNELHSSKPMHNVALVDRLHSYSPAKTTWTIIDNFRFLFGREPMQRAYALSLTRGVQGVGTNFLAHSAGDGARPDVVAWQTELFAWMRKYGGVYARTEPEPVIGIFFGQLQAVQRRVLTGENPPEAALFDGSHEGKVTEALFLCHAAGWPARVITYQELMRDPLPDSMRALLLVGLDEADKSWTWAPGLAAPLQRFLDHGGRILADENSTCPVTSIQTEMRIASYVPQSNFDATPLLFSRNVGNIEKLRAAMDGVPSPVAVSESPTVWAIPTACGDTKYVTVVNQGFAEGDDAKEMLLPRDPKATKPEPWKTKGNASLYVKPQIGALRWTTDRPIYDVRLGRKISASEASTVDLERDAFVWYALPPAEVVQPELVVKMSAAGFFEATATMTNHSAMSGIPVQFTVARGNDSAAVFSTTGAPTRLPLSLSDAAGEYTVTATELLTGLNRVEKVNVKPPRLAPTAQGVQMPQRKAVAKFAARKHVALTIALTEEQLRNPEIVKQAKALADFYRQQKRIVPGKFALIAPGGIVESLQPLRSPNRYPQWKTSPTDLILIGTPANNLLIMDQARAHIFPSEVVALTPGRPEVIYTRSPFVGEYDAVNILASDPSDIAAAVAAIKVSGAAK